MKSLPSRFLARMGVGLTVAVAVVVGGAGAERAQAAAAQHCPAGRSREVCIDLSHQTLWVREGSRTVFGPVPIRSGRRGHATPDGRFSIQWRDYGHWSTTYDSPMPFSQFFAGGDAIHGVYDDVHEGQGSYGCVNLLFDDAERLWGLLRVGDPVDIWGRKPGT
jgi:lipoprotein-anchoring transpeptidase ErfK/SrfK